jgi:ankyrin
MTNAPFMAKFVIFSKRHEVLEARLRVYCMTDDKEDKTLEHQEHFMEVAKSREVEVLEGKTHHIEFSGNLIPVTKSGDQLQHKFHAFRENRLPFTIKVKDPHSEPMGRIVFMREAKQDRKEAPQTPICTLNIALPENITPESHHTDADLVAIQAKYSFLREAGYGKFDTIHRADLRVSDISNLLGSDWVGLARELDIEDQDINLIRSEYPDNVCQQAMVMLRLWLNTEGNRATGNALEKALRKCDREDIVNKCIFNIEMVTDEMEKSFAQTHLDQSGFDAFKAELGPSTNSTLKRDYSMDVSYDEQDVLNRIDDENERLAGIAEEVTISREISKQINNKQEEATSVYEREEQKYIAVEKEVVTSVHEESTEKHHKPN